MRSKAELFPRTFLHVSSSNGMVRVWCEFGAISRRKKGRKRRRRETIAECISRSAVMGSYGWWWGSELIPRGVGWWARTVVNASRGRGVVRTCGIVYFYRGNITFLLPETTQARNDSAAGRSRHDDLRELHDVMESSSRRAAFEPRPHQGASWPSTAGLTSSSRLWLLRRRAARGEFGPHSRRPGRKLLHPTPPAAVPIPVCLEISPFWPRHSSRPYLDRLSKLLPCI